MIGKIKLALRVSADQLNEEIEDCIDACYRDMARVGIRVYEEDGNIRDKIETDGLVISCQKLYARWQFNFEGAAERYRAAYESTRDAMSLSSDYK